MTDKRLPRDSSVELPPTARSTDEGLPPTINEPPSPSEAQSPTQDYVGTTGAAPSFHAPVTGPKKGRLVAGDRIDDYEILSVLGAGAFATVYLARQVSLDRQVALKVSANRGDEARTLASLEH